jgi:hypothetical protein
VALVFLGPGLLLGSFLVAGSARSIYQRASSPDRWHEARVQFDDGGAVSRFSRLVFVKHSWNVSDEPLLSCRAFWGDGEAEVTLQWLDNNTLLVRHHFAPQNVEATARNCGSVRIVVQAVQPYEQF